MRIVLRNLPELARDLGLSAKFLKQLSDEGRVPFVSDGGPRRLYDPLSVELALAAELSARPTPINSPVPEIQL